MNVRKAHAEDAEGIARVHVDAWRDTYRSIVPDKALADLSYDIAKRNWENGISDSKNRTSVFVAQDRIGHIAGFAACGAVRGREREYEGELYAIYLDKGVRGKGLGKRLLIPVVQDLKTRGFDSMIVWVFEENPNKRFCESLGGKVVRRGKVAVGGKRLNELGFGWRDLDSLAALLRH